MTPAEIKQLYPAIASVPDAVLTAQIQAFGLIYQGDYGELHDYLLGLYVAHQSTVFGLNSASTGPQQTVTARSVTDMSWTYAQSGQSAKAGDFASTKYGLEFYRLMSMFGQGPVMAGAQ